MRRENMDAAQQHSGHIYNLALDLEQYMLFLENQKLVAHQVKNN
jgi:hypothetical protein